MRTALFVYAPSSVIIETHELGAELSTLGASSVVLGSGSTARTLERGVHMIVSNDCVDLRGELDNIDTVVTTQNKENGPIPPLRASALVDPIGASTLQAFFAVPEAKTLVNP
jgi:hypothetical protein